MIAPRNRSSRVHLPSRTVLAGLIASLAGMSAAADTWMPRGDGGNAGVVVPTRSMMRGLRPAHDPGQTRDQPGEDRA
jgi:hypothetical protein